MTHTDTPSHSSSEWCRGRTWRWEEHDSWLFFFASRSGARQWTRSQCTPLKRDVGEHYSGKSRGPALHVCIQQPWKLHICFPSFRGVFRDKSAVVYAIVFTPFLSFYTSEEWDVVHLHIAWGGRRKTKAVRWLCSLPNATTEMEFGEGPKHHRSVSPLGFRLSEVDYRESRPTPTVQPATWRECTFPPKTKWPKLVKKSVLGR